jgi:hypothetical protein
LAFGAWFLIGASCDGMDSGRRFDRNPGLPSFASDAALQRRLIFTRAFANLSF